MTPSPLDSVVDLVAKNGMDRTTATVVGAYMADRCAALSLATLHSSGRSSLHRDQYLTGPLELTPRQISAWLALIRGTRAVRQRGGRVVGGCPGMTQLVASGTMDAAQLRRFARLARTAAGGRPDATCQPSVGRTRRRTTAG